MDEILNHLTSTSSKNLEKQPSVNENKMDFLLELKKKELFESSKMKQPPREGHRVDEKYKKMQEIITNFKIREEEKKKSDLLAKNEKYDLNTLTIPKKKEFPVKKKSYLKKVPEINIPIKSNDEKMEIAALKLQQQNKNKLKSKLMSNPKITDTKNKIISNIVEEIDLNILEDKLKNDKDDLKIIESKSVVKINSNESNGPNEKSFLDQSLFNTHGAIFPINYKKVDPYRNYTFSTEDIYEKVMDFRYLFDEEFKEEYNSVLFKKEDRIPNAFSSMSQYIFLWSMHYFIELKSQLQANKVDKYQKDRFNNLTIYLTPMKNSLDSPTNLYFVNLLSENVNLDMKEFRENDMFILFEDTYEPIFKNVTSLETLKEALKKMEPSSDSLSFCKKKSLKNVFLGIFYLEKQDNSEQKNVLCKVNSLMEAISNQVYFKIRLICNLTTNIREFEGILNSEKYFLNDLIKDPKTFLKASSSLCLNHQRVDLNGKINEKQENYLMNCQNHFNESQYHGIINSANLNLSDVLLIQGPPGTGKTHTIIGILSLIYLNTNSNILVCTPSNKAIDEITLRLAKKGLYNYDMKKVSPNFLRFGYYDKQESNLFESSVNSELLKQQTLEYKVDLKFKGKENQVNNEIDKLNSSIRQIDENIENIRKYGTSNKKEQIRLNELSKERSDIYRQVIMLKMEKSNQINGKKLYEKQILESTRIICTTLNSSGHEKLRNFSRFDYLIIDEACQCTEPSALIPFSLGAKKVIMVGDHMQLPATVFAESASKTLFNRSLFERLIDNNFPTHLLKTQYRMNVKIREFIGKTFYNGELKDSPELIHKMKKEKITESIPLQMCFFDLVYSKENNCQISKSYINYQEIDFIVTLLSAIHTVLNFDYYLKNSQSFYRIAIISPYKAQVRALTEKFIDTFPKEYLDYIEINTIDSFQGREQDIVIISTVRSNSNEKYSSIGFLNDYRRMNVALSRAKYCCLVVGNSKTLIINKYWESFYKFSLDNKVYYRFDTPNQVKQEKIESLLKTGSLNRKHDESSFCAPYTNQNSNSNTKCAAIVNGKFVRLHKKDKIQIKKNSQISKDIASSDLMESHMLEDGEIVDLDRDKNFLPFAIHIPESNSIKKGLDFLCSSEPRTPVEKMTIDVKNSYFLHEYVYKK